MAESKIFNQIPKILHIIWIGDEATRPDKFIDTWRKFHPDWKFKLWGNDEYRAMSWKTQKQMKVFEKGHHWAGIADLMRYEILLKMGGVYVDADSYCVRKLDDWLLDTKMFAIWESERHRPGLIANGFIGSLPRHPALISIVEGATRLSVKTWKRSWKNPLVWVENPVWKSVGPLYFTKKVMPFCPVDVTILPSVLFLPKHIEDEDERVSSLVYSGHEWGSQKSP